MRVFGQSRETPTTGLEQVLKVKVEKPLDCELEPRRLSSRKVSPYHLY